MHQGNLVVAGATAYIGGSVKRENLHAVDSARPSGQWAGHQAVHAAGSTVVWQRHECGEENAARRM